MTGSMEIAGDRLRDCLGVVEWNDIAQDIAAVMQMAVPSLKCARFRHVCHNVPHSHNGRAFITLESKNQSCVRYAFHSAVIRCTDVLERVIGSQPLCSGGYSYRTMLQFPRRSVRQTPFISNIKSRYWVATQTACKSLFRCNYDHV